MTTQLIPREPPPAPNVDRPVTVIGRLSPSQIAWAHAYMAGVLRERHPEWFGEEPGDPRPGPGGGEP